MSNKGGVMESIRDIFRKDPGLSGDAQRMEQLGTGCGFDRPLRKYNRYATA